jgi:glycosyltransferase involved in cell wall biosynthesis
MRRRPLRIVAYVHGLYPHQRAGSETMLADMLEALADQGHDVHAVATLTGPADGSTTWEYGGVTCWREGPGKAAAFVAALEPDVIVSHHHIGPEAIPLAKRIGAASVVILHNDFKWSRAVLNARPDLLVFNTYWLRRKMGTRGAAAVVVHPPLHADRYALDREGPPADGAVTIVNLDRIKGPDVFYSLARNMPDTPFLAVRGGYGKQDERTGYPNVEFMDTTTNIRDDVWARSRVVVAPSRYESYGRGVVEACAAGVPVVATATAGLRESLGPGGTFASRGNPAEWLRYVTRLMHDDAAWARASRAALARADELDAMRTAELLAWSGAVASAGLTARRRRERRRPPMATV